MAHHLPYIRFPILGLTICVFGIGSLQGQTGMFPDDERPLPFVKQTMKGLSHRYFDPVTGVPRYQVKADKAVTRLKGNSVVFDVERPSLRYFDKEELAITSKNGEVHLAKGKERIHLMGGVVGYFDAARTAKFETKSLEMSFNGDGQSKDPIRFTQTGVTLVGERSVFFRIEVPGKTSKEKIAKVVVFGPGYARFNKKKSATSDARTDSFLVEFEGSASYSQLRPVIFFNSRSDDKDDRVTLYGEGYVLRSRELQVHALGRLKSWERLNAKGNVHYSVKPGLRVKDRFAELKELDSIRGLQD
ncbi:MAG: hypothetical protein QF437_03740 [Planctomycetota bacterium]|nr:hypothetical protein [Planctomycetota bacterium]